MKKNTDVIYVTKKNNDIKLTVKGREFNISSTTYDTFVTLKNTGVNNKHYIADTTSKTLIIIDKYGDDVCEYYAKLTIHRLSSIDRTKKECVFNPKTDICIFNVDDGESIRIGYSNMITRLADKKKLESIVYKTEVKTSDKINVRLKIYPISKGSLLELNGDSYYIPSYDIFADLKNISDIPNGSMSYILEDMDGDERWSLKVTNNGHVDSVKLVFKKGKTYHFVFLDIEMINDIHEYLKDALLYLSILPNNV